MPRERHHSYRAWQVPGHAHSPLSVLSYRPGLFDNQLFGAAAHPSQRERNGLHTQQRCVQASLPFVNLINNDVNVCFVSAQPRVVTQKDVKRRGMARWFRAG
jgi:hypothetical protein